MPHGILVIHYNKGHYQMVLKMRQYYISTPSINYEYIVQIIHHFISCYQYPYYDDDAQV